ncbi:hypothetical protein C8034_v005697 [Colletotrichum sidae]|uniref:Uncharacterized protein n=1 Tax=Colletotrichum sidae TaxID=1347389 RepID=A0A4R8TRE5_9PEZI|nr:hypothetical protein C8034_v005697 [Colletotrichum sidae]
MSESTRASEETVSPADGVITLERMGHDVPYPSVEHTLSRPASVPGHESIVMTDFAILPSHKPRQRIYFFKRIFDGCPRFDALIAVGEGTVLPNTPEYNFNKSLWEVTENLYVFRKEGPQFVVLQSISTALFQTNTSAAKTKWVYQPKTLGFLAIRNANGEMHVLKMTISGSKFSAHPSHTSTLRGNKWTSRVKHLASMLGLKMSSIYDGCGKRATAEDRGNWAAGHCEKKLATFAVYSMLYFHKVRPGTDFGHVTRSELNALKSILHGKERHKEFEIHISRPPCGTPKRPGACVSYVSKLGRAAGIDFTIHQWKQNLILDGSVPAHVPKSTGKQSYQRDEDSSDDCCDSEQEDLDVDVADTHDDWRDYVFDGFDEASDDVHLQSIRTVNSRASSTLSQQEVSPQALHDFAERIKRDFGHKDRRPRDEVPKPYPPTPASQEDFNKILSPIQNQSSSHYFEEPQQSAGNEIGQRMRSARAEAKKRRRDRMQDQKKKRAAIEEAAKNAERMESNAIEVEDDIYEVPREAEASVIAARLGGLARFSRRLG